MMLKVYKQHKNSINHNNNYKFAIHQRSWHHKKATGTPLKQQKTPTTILQASLQFNVACNWPIYSTLSLAHNYMYMTCACTLNNVICTNVCNHKNKVHACTCISNEVINHERTEVMKGEYQTQQYNMHMYINLIYFLLHIHIHVYTSCYYTILYIWM